MKYILVLLSFVPLIHGAVPAKKVLPSTVWIQGNREGKSFCAGGVIVSTDGYIVTCSHVVTQAKKLRVQLYNSTKLVECKVIANLADQDLAIIKIKATKLTPIIRTKKYKLGQDVMAVGHPKGYDFTITKGIVSHLDREIELPTKVVLKHLVQTDAPINPGNSGGPVTNMDGAMIGIVSCIADDGTNLAFIIPTRIIFHRLKKWIK